LPELPFKFTATSDPHRSLSDRDLIGICLKGDKRAWDALINRYVALLYSTCLRSGLSSADSEDVVQDVCVILLDHLVDVRDTAKLSSWLISTTKREVWRFQKRKGLKLASELGETEWSLDSGTGIHTETAQSPETAVLELEEQQMVRQAMDKLADRCRRMLTLLYCQETPASYTKIADELSLPVGSIGPTRARCLQSLRKVLAELGFH
jgi:RNA polymerase sigma factor (sigma-70 family)